MKKINVTGFLFSARIEDKNGKITFLVYEWDSKIETINEFAQAVYADVKTNYPDFNGLWVSEYGDMEADTLVEVDREYGIEEIGF